MARFVILEAPSEAKVAINADQVAYVSEDEVNTSWVHFDDGDTRLCVRGTVEEVMLVLIEKTGRVQPHDAPAS